MSPGWTSLLGVEGLAPQRKQIHEQTILDRHSAVAVEFNFVEPSRPVDQLWDGSAVHWFDELGCPFWQTGQARLK